MVRGRAVRLAMPFMTAAHHLHKVDGGYEQESQDQNKPECGT